MEYVRDEDPVPYGCIFEAAAGEACSKEALLLYRDTLVTVLMNRYPYSNGHLLVAPNRHCANLAQLSDDEHLALMQRIERCVAILQEYLQPDGFNVGLNLGIEAGAGIAEHLHFHIVPRWQGDHNFMTVLAEVRTIPEHIERTFDMLLPHFEKLDFG